MPNLTLKISGRSLEELLKYYAEIVLHGLLTCEVAEGLEELCNKISDANWFIVFGGDQTELLHVFSERELAKYFDGGIFGSPDNKDQIFNHELSNGNISQPDLFLGDSKHDYQVATKANLDFVFLSGWSEVAG